MYWINTLPGRRCLLASSPADLMDGGVLAELTSMLLGSNAMRRPATEGGRAGQPTGAEEAKMRIKTALDALARAHLGFRPSDAPAAAGPAVGARGKSAATSASTRQLAARVAEGEPGATLFVFTFLRDALRLRRSADGSPPPAAAALRRSFSSARAHERVTDRPPIARTGSLPPSPVSARSSRSPRSSLAALEVLSGEVAELIAGARSAPAPESTSDDARGGGLSPRRSGPSSGGLSTLSRLASGDLGGEIEEAGDDAGSLSEWAEGRLPPESVMTPAGASDDTLWGASSAAGLRGRHSGTTGAGGGGAEGRRWAPGSVSRARALGEAAEAAEAAAEAVARAAVHRAASGASGAHGGGSPSSSLSFGGTTRGTPESTAGSGHGGHGGSPTSQYARGFPSAGEAAQAWCGTRSSLVALTPGQQDVVVWMLAIGMDVPGAHVLRSGEIVALPTAGEVQSEMAKGLMLCDLVSILEGVFLGTLNHRPKVVQEAMHNINKALAVLRRGCRASTQHLWSTSEVAAGKAAETWGLLSDIAAAYAHFPVERHNLRVAPHVDARTSGRVPPVDTSANASSPGRSGDGAAWRSGDPKTLPGGRLKKNQAAAAAALGAWMGKDGAIRLATRGGGGTRGSSSSTGRSGGRSEAPPRQRRPASASAAPTRPPFRSSGTPSSPAPSRRERGRTTSTSSSPRATSAPRERRDPSPPPAGSIRSLPGSRGPSPPNARASTRTMPMTSSSVSGRARGGVSDTHRRDGPITPPRAGVAAARAAAQAATAMGNVPVVFDYVDGPPPSPPPARLRDEEVREWLRSLRLGVLPREEAAELLSNPLRNGVLLSDLMTVLVGAPPLGRRERRPRTLAAARANVERALVPLRTMPNAIPPSLAWSTEGILKGMRENVFGLLWYVKQAVPKQRSFARAPVASLDDGNGGEGLGSFPPNPAVHRPSSAASPSAAASAQPPAGMWGEGSAVVTGTGTTFQYVPVPATSAPKAPPPRGGGAPAASGTVERGLAFSGYEALPYADEDVRRLETSVVRWLHGMGLLPEHAVGATFAALCPEMAKGVLLCDLVVAIEGVPVVGVFRPPKRTATAEANVRRACERLARHRGMSRRFLFNHADIAAGTPGVVLGLLEDIRVFYDGLPPRTQGSKHWDLAKPYCPDEPEKKETPLPATGRGATTTDAGGAGETSPQQAGLQAVSGGPSSAPPAIRTVGWTRDVVGGEGDEEDADVAGQAIDEGEARPPGEGAWVGYVDVDVDVARTPPMSAAPTRLGASLRDSLHVIQQVQQQQQAQPTAQRASDSPTLSDIEPRATPRVVMSPRAKRVENGNGGGGFSPSISTRPTRVGEVPREGTWEAGSFPRRRAGRSEVERNREAAAAAAAAAQVASMRVVSTSGDVPARRLAPVDRSSGSTARRPASSVSSKSTSAATSAAEPASPPRRSRTSARAFPPSPSSRHVRLGAERRRPRSASGGRSPRGPERSGRRVSGGRSLTPEARAGSQNVPPGNAAPRRRSTSSPLGRVDADADVAARGWSAEDRDAVRLARWIDALGVSLRRAGSTLSSPSKSPNGASAKPPGAVEEFQKGKLRPAAELAAACSDGTLLCELVGVLERRDLTGVTWRPRAVASRLHNIGKALEVLRRQPAMSPMNLWCEKDVLKRDVGSVLGLLGDMHACTAYRKWGAR